jgi:hypothetical protein
MQKALAGLSSCASGVSIIVAETKKALHTLKFFFPHSMKTYLDVQQLALAGIPKGQQQLQISTELLDESYIKLLKEYRQRLERARTLPNLLIEGGRLSGKTSLGCYLLKAAMVFDKAAKYCDFPEAVSAFLTHEATPATYAKTSVLCVDNLKRETHAYYPTALQRLLQTAIDHDTALILLTPLDDEAFAATYGPDNYDLVSRICRRVSIPSLNIDNIYAERNREE